MRVPQARILGYGSLPNFAVQGCSKGPLAPTDQVTLPYLWIDPAYPSPALPLEAICIPCRTFIHEQFLSHSFRNLRRCVQKHKLLPKLPGHPHPSVTAVFPPYRQVFHRTGNPPRPCRRNDQTTDFHTIWASSSSISAASRTMMIHSRTCSCRAARYSPIRWPLIS